MHQLLPSIGPQPFDVKEGNATATDWQNLLRSFELFAAASGIKEAVKHNWLLHYAGLKVQNIYFNLPDPLDEEKETVSMTRGKIPFLIEGDDDYSQVVVKLTNYFAPKQNTSYERHMFRKLIQEKDERIDSFVMRLREQADRCGFGSQKDDNIKDQITASCYSDSLRRKILERGDQGLDSIMKLARIVEAAANQQESFTSNSKLSNDTAEEKNEVCEINTRKVFKQKYFDQYKPDRRDQWDCGRCGLKGHKSSDGKCPAKGKKCLKCGKMDHFARKCLTKSNNGPPSKKFKREPIRMINEYDDYDDVFCVSTGESNDNKIWCKIGGVEVEVVVDSGTKRNIVDRESWLDLKANDIVTNWRRKEVDIGFTSYGGHRLYFMGMFEASVQIGQKQVMAKFYVANELGKFLLGYETAKLLGVLKIGMEVKEKGKQYADSKRRAKPNEIMEGDDVVLKRRKLTNKLSSTFEPTTYKVKERNGSEIVVENAETLTQYRRNVAHAKKVPAGGFHSIDKSNDFGGATNLPNLKIAESDVSSNLQGTTSVPSKRLRSERVRIAPKRYGFDD